MCWCEPGGQLLRMRAARHVALLLVAKWIVYVAMYVLCAAGATVRLLIVGAYVQHTIREFAVACVYATSSHVIRLRNIESPCVPGAQMLFVARRSGDSEVRSFNGDAGYNTYSSMNNKGWWASTGLSIRILRDAIHDARNPIREMGNRATRNRQLRYQSQSESKKPFANNRLGNTQIDFTSNRRKERYALLRN